MLTRFKLEVKLDEKLVQKLKNIWNTEYADVYDDLYFSEDSLSENELEADLDDLLKSRTQDESSNYKHNFYIGLSFCNAVFPSLEGNLNDDLLHSFELFLKIIQESDQIGGEDLPSLPDIDDVPGIVAESVSVFHDMREMIESRNYRSSILSMIDSCILGGGICHGSSDKRAILNWFLTDVFPCSQIFEAASYNYSVKTRLLDGWTYSKV